MVDFYVHMNASAIEVYEIFKENLKLGEEKASMVIKYLESSTAEKIASEIKSKIAHLATKENINGLRSELKDDINELRGELRDDIVANREEILKLESSLRGDMLKLESSLRGDMLKLESSLKDGMSQLRAGTKDDINAVREDVLKLENSISKKHFGIIKWMFIFWVGAVATIITVMKVL